MKKNEVGDDYGDKFEDGWLYEDGPFGQWGEKDPLEQTIAAKQIVEIHHKWRQSNGTNPRRGGEEDKIGMSIIP